MSVSFSLYQLLVPLFACIMIGRGISKYRRHQQTVRELISIITIWFAISLTAVFPDFVMRWLSLVTGIKSGLNALIFFTLIILIYGLLQLLIKFEVTERTITDLVRKIALREFETKRKNNS